MSANLPQLIENYFTGYCSEKKYTIVKLENPNYTRLTVSNLIEKIHVDIYSTGSIVIGGSQKQSLHKEFDEQKQKVKADPDILSQVKQKATKACTAKYNILLQTKRDEIKNAFLNFEEAKKTYDNPTPSEDYRLKIEGAITSLAITQFKNGTLLLQGKEGNLFDEACELIEKTATPSQQEVITRFISSDEEALQKFSSRYTPTLLENAENNLRSRIGDAFNFLEAFDQKYLIASECLRLCDILLPEYSAVVMPASKAFEGFTKKLLIKIGFYPANHFASKTANLSKLNDKTHPDRTTLISKEKYAGTYLDNLSNALDKTRNFMMHSDSSAVTKVNTLQEASDKLDDILDNLKEIFNYFNRHEFGGIYP
jgi:hypothetical protein